MQSFLRLNKSFDACYNFFCVLFYSELTDFFFKDSAVDSQLGVQRGNPEGPVLFSLAITLLIVETESKIPKLSQHCCYLGDKFFAGIENEFCKALEVLTESGRKCCGSCGRISVKYGQSKAMQRMTV